MKDKNVEALASLKLKQETGSLLDVFEGAAFCGLSVFTIRAYIARREIPFLKVGTRCLLDPASLSKWRDAKRVPTFAEELRSRKAATLAAPGRRTRAATG